jgi:hypothetical protein
LLLHTADFALSLLYFCHPPVLPMNFNVFVSGTLVSSCLWSAAGHDHEKSLDVAQMACTCAARLVTHSFCCSSTGAS